MEHFADPRPIYIVACQQGGLSEEPPWLRAATRHGPLTLFQAPLQYLFWGGDSPPPSPIF